MRKFLVSLAVLVGACTPGGGPTTTTTADPLGFAAPPAVSAEGHDSVVVAFEVRPRPAKAQMICPGLESVGSGVLAFTHRLVQRSLTPGTSYNCALDIWEDGGAPVRANVSFRTKVEPCMDPSPATARIELEYIFPSDFPEGVSYIEVVGYPCGSSTRWSGDIVHAAPVNSGTRVVRAQWNVPINHPFGSKDHEICVLRMDDRILLGADFTLRVVGGGAPVNLTRVTRLRPFDSKPEMDCQPFRVSGTNIYP
jgi:hypothetical protein